MPIGVLSSYSYLLFFLKKITGNERIFIGSALEAFQRHNASSQLCCIHIIIPPFLVQIITVKIPPVKIYTQNSYTSIF